MLEASILTSDIQETIPKYFVEILITDHKFFIVKYKINSDKMNYVFWLIRPSLLIVLIQRA